jgi:hypothetical protein
MQDRFHKIRDIVTTISLYTSLVERHAANMDSEKASKAADQLLESLNELSEHLNSIQTALTWNANNKRKGSRLRIANA